MNIQPNCKKVNQFIETSEYFSLLQEQRLHSFIGEELNIWADKALEKRVEELIELEKKGFVFHGEKNWLLKFIQNGRIDDYSAYDKWVTENFTSFLGLCFAQDDSYPSGMDKTWKAILPASGYLLKFNELKNPAFEEVEELELFVGGNNVAPSPMHPIELTHIVF